MAWIDWIRIGLGAFIAVEFLILALHPGPADMKAYQDWIDFFDKRARQRRRTLRHRR